MALKKNPMISDFRSEIRPGFGPDDVFFVLVAWHLSS